MRIERSIEIAVPPERVFDTIMDPRRLGDWVTIHAGLHDPPDQLSEGAELSQSLRIAGRTFRVEWLVARVERPGAVSWEGCGPLGTKARVHYSFSQRNGGTCFDYVNEYDFPGGPLGRLGAKAFERTAIKEADRSLARLKGLLER